MERFVLAMDQIAFGHGAFLFLHGAISHRPWNTRRFNRLDSQSDRRVLGVDRQANSRHSQDIGVEDVLWAKKLCQEDTETFNGLKRESATD